MRAFNFSGSSYKSAPREPFTAFADARRSAETANATEIPFTETPAEIIPLPPERPPLLNRVLKGLPGFMRDTLPSVLAGAGAVAVAKCTIGGLCATTSAPALVAAGAVIAAGATVSQTFSYIRERKAELNAQSEIAAAADETGATKVQKASFLRGIFNKEARQREMGLFSENLKTKDFWVGAATKGAIGTVLGGGLAFLADNETVQEYAGKGIKAATAYIDQNETLKSAFAKAGNVFASWREGMSAFRSAGQNSGTAHAAIPPITPGDVAPPALAPERVVAQVVDQQVAARAEAAGERVATQTVDQQVAERAQAVAAMGKEPVTLIDKARALFASYGANQEAVDKILTNTQLSEAQRVKDAAVGIGNGKYGFTEANPEAAKAALKLAADNGNAQAARDLGLNGKPLPPKADLPAAPKVVPQAATPAAPVAPSAAPATPSATPAAASPAVAEDTRTTYEKAMQSVAHLQSQEADPAQRFANDFALDKAPQQVGTEAGGCVMGVGGQNRIHTLCNWFKNVVSGDDHVLMRSADGTLESRYVPNGPQSTEEFVEKSRRAFRVDFKSMFGAQLR